MPRITTWHDGDNDCPSTRCLQRSIQFHWANEFPGAPPLVFSGVKNLKLAEDLASASKALKAIAYIRNPDVFFQLEEPYVEIGGVEITVHSPDGSNADKRYPYLWASRQHLLDAFIVCPYQKTRTQGALNRLPFRHARRNRHFAERWAPAETQSPLLQILPITDLQQGIDQVPESVAREMWSFNRIGEFFAMRIAQYTLDRDAVQHANTQLERLRASLLSLISACEDNTNHADPSALFLTEDRWIQIYNSRPDSGHWERGEGQFDSIDGRLMFTLDEIDLLAEDERPDTLELWLPQMVREHPWIQEQHERGFGSKRFRNITQTLQEHLVVRYANDLDEEDWAILESNPSLTLERLDWAEDVFKISDVMAGKSIAEIAHSGVRTISRTLISQVEDCLHRPNLFFSAHRATRAGWNEALQRSVSRMPADSTLIVPRLPRHLLAALRVPCGVTVVPAEEVSKVELLALRQLHRTSTARTKANGWTG